MQNAVLLVKKKYKIRSERGEKFSANTFYGELYQVIRLDDIINHEDKLRSIYFGFQRCLMYLSMNADNYKKILEYVKIFC